jgi:hypothetical protein
MEGSFYNVWQPHEAFSTGDDAERPEISKPSNHNEPFVRPLHFFLG